MFRRVNLKMTSLPALAGIGLIKVYQFTLGSLLGGHCRFHPSCSVYGIEAIKTHGLLKGSWLALTRIARCHPFSRGGIDPVPGARHPANCHCFVTHGEK